jgi:EAL domain-containing protein (putative c-di-GMP-specific phosphodiesterase class I)
MGYAYAFGDLFIELDLNHIIKTVDGPLSEAAEAMFGLAPGRHLIDHLCRAGQAKIAETSNALKGFSRIGPFELELSKDSVKTKKFIAFICRLPNKADSVFLSLTSETRYGRNQASGPERALESFVDKLQNLSSAEAAEDNLVVTVVQKDGFQQVPMSDEAVHERLTTYSLGGDHATILSNGKYAIVRELGQPDIDIAHEIAAVTGLTLSSADISADALKAGDNLKALIYGLQEFAEGNPDFSIAAFKSESVSLFEEASSKVREFREIIANDAFDLLYQPVVSLASNDVHHYEALARFPHKGLDTSPYETISFAERTSIIDDFDLAVFYKVTDTLIEMEKHGNLRHLAINISGKSMSQQRFLDKLLARLAQIQRFSEMLSFELTESFKIENLEETAQNIDKIRAYGFKVYLDDFGSDAAGFQYLKALNIDALKIDGSYIRNALNSKKDRALLVAITALCKELKIKTVAEWVETPAIAKLVKDVGVDLGQGYYFGRPSDIS